MALKSALLEKTGEDFKTHNVGGIFGKHFKNQVGHQKCKRVNKILMRYNFPRYPDQPSHTKEEVIDDIEFISKLIKEDINEILK